MAKDIIVVVDDDLTVLEILSEMLLKLNYEVRPFVNANLAIDFIKANDKIDLILLDVYMPLIDGYDLCKKIKSIESIKNIPIIFISALNEQKDIETGLEAGAVDYITKPFFVNEVKLKIKNHLLIHNFSKILEQKVQEELDKNRQKEQVLIQQSKMAATGEMIGAIAHQWKQPLNFLSLHTQMLQDAFEENEIDQKFISNFIEKNMAVISFMNQTIIDFRNFSRPTKEKENFDVLESIQQVIRLYGGELKVKNIFIEICCLSKCGNDCRYVCYGIDNQQMLICKESSYIVYGLQNEFKQVILNLINNAKDVILEKKISNGKILIYINSESDCITVEIEDNGGGIETDMLNQIFNLYFSTKGENGTGIGLYISKVIIEQHMGGELTVSNGEFGAKFKIQLKG